MSAPYRGITSVRLRAEAAQSAAQEMSQAKSLDTASENPCKVLGMPVPAFPVGAVKDKVMRWRDDFESVLMLAKG